MSIKQPPIFDPNEDDDYTEWKSDIEIWQLFTDIRDIKQGPAVYLTLRGRARDAVRGLTAGEIGAADGVANITAKLDEAFETDPSTRAYCAFKEFVEYRRAKGETFSQFIVEFESKYRNISKYKLTLPEGVQAFFLLNAANLTPDTEKLARATAELTYKDMKEKLTKIFGNSSGSNDSKDTLPIKEEALCSNQTNSETTGEEEALMGYEKRGRGKSRARGRGWNRGWNRGNRFRDNDRADRQGSSIGNMNQGEKTNPTDATGKPMRCFECESTKHFSWNCPHRKETAEANVAVHITLLGTENDNKQINLLVESLGKGLLDSGCTKTVAGEIWLKEYLSTLSNSDNCQVKEQTSNAVFRFGDGVESKSLKRVTIPVWIGTKEVMMDVEVVSNEIPLLLSKAAMKQMEMKLDFVSDIAVVGGQKVPLVCNSLGHYCIQLAKERIDEQDCNVVLHIQNLESMTMSEKQNKALKLHKQLSHATKYRLLKLLRDSGCKDK